MKKTLLSLLLLAAAAGVQAQQPLTVAEFTWVADHNGNLSCIESTRPASSLEKSAAAFTRQLSVIESTLKSAGGDGHLNIILRATDQLKANPTAQASFVKAAEAWEQVILTPVTIVIDVDYGPTRFGSAYSSSSVIGSTSSAIYAATTGKNATGNPETFQAFGETLSGKHEGLSSLYSAIPSPLTADLGTINYPIATRSNLQALGYFDAVTSDVVAFGQTPNIGFNSAFSFDFDQSDGIASSLTDFQGVTIHEIGHALGFVSSIGYSDGYCTTWDIFRFRPGAVSNLDEFYSATRVLTAGPLTAGGDHVFWDGNEEFEVSTGNSNGTGGDTRQSSHWRDDALRSTLPAAERKIGIMDPTVARGELVRISEADLRLLAVIGWDIDFGNKLSPPTQFRAFSDFETPTSMKVSWLNPESFYDGRIATDFKLVLLQNGAPIQEYSSPEIGAEQSLTVVGLTPGASYTYEMLPIHTVSGDTGISASFLRIAGGSLAPAASESIPAVNNGTTSIFSLTVPARHNDGTRLHNLSGYQITRVRDKAVFTGTLNPADTGKVITFIDTAPVGSAFATRYEIRFTGSGSETVIGDVALSEVQRLGTPLTTLAETFEGAAPYKVVGTSGWTVEKKAFMSSNAIGISSVISGMTETAFLAAVKPAAGQGITYRTIALLDPAVSSGTVELSSDAGKTWIAVKTLNWNSNPDWAAGTTTWVKESIPLTDYVGKPVLFRFTLTSTGAGSKDQSWYLDDFTLETVTGVADEQLVSRLNLEPNYPNPFNPSTVIGFTLPVQSKVTVKVLNILGQEITTLVDGIRPAGHHEVTFSAAGLPSGLYFCRMTSSGQSFTRKMILSK
ncbi:MAG: NF038122 family metalloprotease [Bacteroidetes bacterium]|nr:NF038122 family metalloprotease [Bacteroidota bacterium]